MKLDITDLKYDYSKRATSGEYPEYTSVLDRVLFHRDEEFEVFPMLKAMIFMLDIDTIDEIHILEDMIRYDMPEFIRKRVDVFNWLLLETKPRNIQKYKTRTTKNTKDMGLRKSYDPTGER